MKNFLNKQIIMSKKIILLIIAVFVIVAIVAVLIPRLRSDGLEALNVDEQIFGKFAMSVAYQNFDNPIQRILLQKIKVRQVTKKDSTNICDIDDILDKSELMGDYSATIDFLTFFGIRFYSENINCSG